MVSYFNGTYRYYPVPPEQGWKLDTMNRCLVIGRGVPRTWIPLDNVASYIIEEY